MGVVKKQPAQHREEYHHQNTLYPTREGGGGGAGWLRKEPVDFWVTYDLTWGGNVTKAT